MSDLLSIGASGVRAYQSALTTVSDNIANTGVAGYSKRSVDLKELAPVANGLAATGAQSGNGVVVAGVVRAADAFKAEAVRTAGADLARTETGATWLTSIQSALTGNKLGDRLTSFFTSATTLAADPTSLTSRSAMLEAGTSVASAFAATGDALDQVATDLDTTATAATQTLGSLSTALAKVNGGLARTQAGTAAAASFADQRDQLLEQMSAIVDTNVTTDASGRATVRLGGSSGPVLVSGSDAGTVGYARSAAGAVSFTVTQAGTVSSFSPSGGALAGMVDGAQRIADARTSIDAIASAFTTQVNAVQAAGRDLDGTAGAAMFATGDSATDITLSLTDPRGIAAAGAGKGTRDASNLTALQSVRTGAGFEAKTTALVAANATAIQQRTTVAEAQTAIRDGAVGARDAVSGTNLDTEAVDLLRFQQAYQASSRVIQVARETFNSILELR